MKRTTATTCVACNHHLSAHPWLSKGQFVKSRGSKQLLWSVFDLSLISQSFSHRCSCLFPFFIFHFYRWTKLQVQVDPRSCVFFTVSNCQAGPIGAGKADSHGWRDRTKSDVESKFIHKHLSSGRSQSERLGYSEIPNKYSRHEQWGAGWSYLAFPNHRTDIYERF